MLVYVFFPVALCLHIVIVAPTKSTNNVMCKCGIFRTNQLDSPMVVETIIGEPCDDDGDYNCMQNCIEISQTMHFTVTVIDKLCKVYLNANDIEIGLASQTCNDRPLIDTGLRQQISCRDAYYVMYTIPMNLIAKYNVYTDIPNVK